MRVIVMISAAAPQNYDEALRCGVQGRKRSCLLTVAYLSGYVPYFCSKNVDRHVKLAYSWALSALKLTMAHDIVTDRH
jgi:hypothetical protein